MNVADTVRRRWLQGPRKVVFAMAAITVLAACEHLPLYNKEKNELANSAQKAYADIKVTEVLNVQEKNLEKLLKAEIDALNESASLRLDIALLRMSDDRPTPDGSTSLAGWFARAKAEEAQLGFPDSNNILAFLDYRIDVDAAIEQIEGIKGRIKGSGVKAVDALPGCPELKNTDLEAAFQEYDEKVRGLPGSEFLEIDFKEYFKQCKIVARSPPEAEGRVAQAFAELAEAERDLSERKTTAKGLSDEVKAKSEKLKQKRADAQKRQDSLADAENRAKDILKEAKEIADEVLDAFQELRAVPGGEGADLIAEKNIETINTVLVAVGSGQANADGLKDERLNMAVTWIKDNVPSLAADMAALLDQATAPPVSNLILELQHQTIEQNYAKALIALSEQRIEVLRARHRMLIDAAGAWRGFRLALCNFAVLSSGEHHPSEQCDSFLAMPLGPDTAVCTMAEKPLNNCALKLTWQDALKNTSDKRQKRELYSALYQYAEAFEDERASREAEFHLADLQHREALAAQRSGIEAWNNLVAVPIDQLAAYHASGIKPEAIAEAIATALGLSAIGVGVAQ